MGRLLPVQARQTLFTIDGEAEYRPAERFRMTLGPARLPLRRSFALRVRTARVRGRFEARYAVRKVSFGASVAARSERVGGRSWGVGSGGPFRAARSLTVAPFVCDVRADIDWRITGPSRSRRGAQPGPAAPSTSSRRSTAAATAWGHGRRAAPNSDVAQTQRSPGNIELPGFPRREAGILPIPT